MTSDFRIIIAMGIIVLMAQTPTLWLLTHPGKIMLDVTDSTTKEVRKIDLETALGHVVTTLSSNDAAIYNACVTGTRQ